MDLSAPSFLSPNVLGELNRRINGRAAVVALSVLVVVNAIGAVGGVNLTALVANIIAVLVKVVPLISAEPMTSN